MSDPRKPIFAAVSAAVPGVFNDPIDGHRRIGALDSLLDAFGVPVAGKAAKPDHLSEARKKVTPSPTAPMPRWMVEARAWIGTREIPGPKHNPRIVKMRMALGGFGYKDDDIPWCGDFAAHCIKAAGLAIPKMYPRAKAWAHWGKPCAATVGAVVVFGRQGGGHVGFLVGESDANYYVLGGNQSNMVNIMPIAKSRMLAIRWPSELGKPHPGLPKMTGGTVSVNEA